MGTIHTSKASSPDLRANGESLKYFWIQPLQAYASVWLYAMRSSTPGPKFCTHISEMCNAVFQSHPLDVACPSPPLQHTSLPAATAYIAVLLLDSLLFPLLLQCCPQPPPQKSVFLILPVSHAAFPLNLRSYKYDAAPVTLVVTHQLISSIFQVCFATSGLVSSLNNFTACVSCVTELLTLFFFSSFFLFKLLNATQ